MDALDSFISNLLTPERWPFWAVALIFTVVGQFTSQRLFTRERAYAKGRWQPLWWWGRETLPLHPIVSGAALGLLWRDPEGHHWNLVASQVYFAFAGAVSTVLWIVVKGVAKKRGFDLQLPGDSSFPPPAPAPPPFPLP